ncbi:MAG TPA: hypothetical protein VL287_06645 [Gemmatimonadales bacterium]|jgi:hypothetical protein|nr:hypothetical protein [Gemmatimonadales bacterium]
MTPLINHSSTRLQRRAWPTHLVLAAALLGCSHNPSPPPPETGTAAANVVVTVKNLNTSDVTVFANINGQEQRLGTVTSQQTANFELDWGRIGPSGRVSMVVNQIGSSGTYRSGAVTLRPGSQVTVQVAPSLRNSTTQAY